jgi:hypothetical protein
MQLPIAQVEETPGLPVAVVLQTFEAKPRVFKSN